MENKITNKKALAYVLTNCTLPEDVKAKIEAMATALDNKSANKKPTARQLENLTYKEVIANALTDEPVTPTDLMKKIPELADLSTQRITPILHALVDEKVAKVVVVKGRNYFCK